MKKFWLYFLYLIRHKMAVGKFCFEYGLYWRGLIHDWSKFLPSEFIPYANYFYANYPEYKNIHGDARNHINWNQTKEYWEIRFDDAWNLHQKRNKHHWQYWVLLEDSGKVVPLIIPKKYMLEMVADWRGAGVAINGKDDTYEWYNKNKEKMNLHERTRFEVEELLEEIK